MMETFSKILKFQIKDIIRSKWIIFYALFFYLLAEILISYGGNNSKAIAGLLNVTLILVPLISLVFGAIYLYNSREFIELMLSQPINRTSLFFGVYFGLSISLSFLYIIGVGLPFLIHGLKEYSVYLTLLISGFLLTYIFTAISFVISLKFDDKSKGIGVAFIIWIFSSILYDGIVTILIWQLSDYPLEKMIIGISILNPIDMARILVMLKFDAAALMGYTGAVFEKFFGSSVGSLTSLVSQFIWILVPLLLGLRIFKKKDF